MMEIKKELIIKAKPSEVYRAITDPEQLTQWFPDVASIEPKINGKISFRFLKSGTKEAQNHTIEGKITELEKNKRIGYTWGHIDDPEFPLTRVRWDLEEIGIGMTKVTITHTGFTKESQVNTYNDGWTWFTGRLSIFATAKKPVSISSQIISGFIPGLDIFAFYRIKKLRKATLYIILPICVAVGAFYATGEALQTYLEDENNISVEERYFIAIIMMFTILASVLISIAVSNYFMHKWSEEWNQQFLQT